MATKNGRKMTFGKKCHMTLHIPWLAGSKISSTLLFLTPFPRQMHFLCFTQKFKMAAKTLNGYQKNNIWQKVADDCVYTGGKKFHPDSSISYRIGDKYIFAIYPEFQDGCKKLQENVFEQKVPDYSALRKPKILLKSLFLAPLTR